MSDNKEAVLSVRGFSKAFGGRTVLNDVSFDVLEGEVHGLIGQNGSGKSTLIKILAGVYSPESGAEMLLRGTDVSLPVSAAELRARGVSFVHQDLGLAEELSVLENLRVGRYETGLGARIRWNTERRRVREALKRFGLSSVKPDAPVSRLRDVERALVAIVRALDQVEHSGQPTLIVLDEPTAYLPRDGVEHLFGAIREAASSGIGVIFVSHRLDEVQAITDRVTILRDGNLVETSNTAERSEREIVTSILGRSLDELYPDAHSNPGEVVLSASGISTGTTRDGGSVDDLSIEVRRGEIVGCTGLVGMGYERVPYMLFGAEQLDGGSIAVEDREFDATRFTPADAIDARVALLPANRLRYSGVGSATLTENVTLPTLESYWRHAHLNKAMERSSVQTLLDRFEVRPPVPSRLLGQLSGGNQQKALLAKWFAMEPRVFLLHEPTQGVDVGSRQQIFEQMRAAADAGMAILVASAEYEDLAAICDRVIVFRNGRAVATLAGDGLTHERIVERSYLDEVPVASAGGAG